MQRRHNKLVGPAVNCHLQISLSTEKEDGFNLEVFWEEVPYYRRRNKPTPLSGCSCADLFTLGNSVTPEALPPLLPGSALAGGGAVLGWHQLLGWHRLWRCQTRGKLLASSHRTPPSSPARQTLPQKPNTVPHGCKMILEILPSLHLGFFSVAAASILPVLTPSGLHCMMCST